MVLKCVIESEFLLYSKVLYICTTLAQKWWKDVESLQIIDIN